MARTKIFLTEHMNARGISDSEMAEKLKCHRLTVLRARQKPHKLSMNRLQEFASAMHMEDWKELTYPPTAEAKLQALTEEASEALDEFKRGTKKPL